MQTYRRWLRAPLVNMKLQLVAVVLIVAASLHAQIRLMPAETAWTKAVLTGSHASRDFTLSMAALRPQLRGSFSLSGKVSVAGSAADFEFPRLRIRLLAEDGASSEITAAVTKDATFNFTEVLPATYQLRLSGLPDGWYVRSAVLGEENVLSEGLRLKEGNRDQRLEIGIRAGAGRVQGIVIDQRYHDPVANAVVKLFPDPLNPHRWDLARTARTDEYGAFKMENVVPGRYRILAVMGHVDTVDDSQFAAGAGVRVNLGEKQSKHLELELVEAHR